MKVLLFLFCVVLAASALAEGIPPHQAQKIAAAAPAKSRVEPKKPRRVLIFVTPRHLMDKDPHKGYCIPYGTYAFQTLGEKTRAFAPLVSQDLVHFLPENIGQFDCIVLNNTSGRWITPTDEDMARAEFRKHGNDREAVEKVLRASLLDYIEKGGGLAAIHFAIGANSHWPEFRELLGARYAGHPWNEDVAIKLDAPDHPLNAAFAGQDFRIADEIYQFADPYAREKLRVLFSLDTKRTNMDVKWIDRTDGDFALAWVKSFGKGRVFYTALGHRTEIYWNPAILQLYLDGIQFAAGDLEASTVPSAAVSSESASSARDAEEGFESLFNGKDLAGWAGDKGIWSVRDDAITGQTTAQTGLKVNNFLIWEGGEPENFELRLKYKIVGGNSGIYFHAEKQPKGEPLIGPQADFSADGRWTGVVMEWKKRDILAERGQRVEIDESGKRHVKGSLGDPGALLKAVRLEDWNDYRVRVEAEKVTLAINGVTMSEVIDRDPRRAKKGYLALQVHVGPPMNVQFKDLRFKRLPADHLPDRK